MHVQTDVMCMCLHRILVVKIIYHQFLLPHFQHGHSYNCSQSCTIMHEYAQALHCTFCINNMKFTTYACYHMVPCYHNTQFHLQRIIDMEIMLSYSSKIKGATHSVVSVCRSVAVPESLHSLQRL